MYIDVERDGTFEYDFRQWGTIFAGIQLYLEIFIKFNYFKAPIPNAIARLDNSRNDLKRLKGVDNADAVLVYPLTRVGADYETPAANQDAIQTYMMFYYQHFLQDVSYQSDEDLTIFIGPYPHYCFLTIVIIFPSKFYYRDSRPSLSLLIMLRYSILYCCFSFG